MRRIPCDKATAILSPGMDFPYSLSPGETVEIETRDWAGRFPGAPKWDLKLGPNPVTGPLDVVGLEPGQTLAVEILKIEPVAEDWEDLFEPAEGTRPGWVRHAGGIRLPFEPNVGTIAIVPGEGPAQTLHAGKHGGNLDCTVIGPGTTLCFPVQVPGAGFGMGDVHAVMGDGELSGAGLDVPAVVTIRPWRVKGLGITVPYGLRGNRFFITGAGASYTEAIDSAQEGMTQVCLDLFGLSAEEANSLMGYAVSARVGWLRSPTPSGWVEMDITILPEQARRALGNALTEPL